MNRSRTSLTVLVLAVSVWLTPVVAPAEEKSALLDGMVFVGEAGKMGKKSGDREELRFMNGKLHSVTCEPYGFGDGVYFTHTSGSLVAFRAETLSPTHGRMVWRGTVDGDQLEGYFVWHKARKWYRPWKSEAEYWFKAQRSK